MSILITIIIIAILILAHEWGHFIAARRIGIPVYEFSLGFGTKLLSTTRNGVQYSLRLLPLGGFVRMAGEEPGDEDDPNGFNNRTPLEKIRVSFAGPFMNFVLALLLFIYSFAFIGIPESSDEPVLGKVLEGRPAAQAGLHPGDRIISVNDQPVATWSEFTTIIASSEPGETLHIKLNRNGEAINLQVVPDNQGTGGKPAIGVLNQVNYTKLGIGESIQLGLEQTYQLTVLLLSWLGTLFTGGASTADVAGPVGIVSLVGEAAQIGTVFLINFAAYLSINLGIINLLPIPALDGSRIVFAVVQAVRRKPIEPEKEGFIHWLGFLFLMLLIVIVTFNDILRLIKG
ncbi:MAG TPA: RIP metalloprotease RseP [Syntrophomonadaceae bacterium]|nr:RIP metalloprotease RseP [Syntrophomonadaceae bacterium]HQA06895.1 RIP metalloprotease RseP [Syntrophomonadaceae bacterium]HQE22721.1 RIP metalloprotease RseP [Syntrophomonadaceae bacterium]